MVGEYLADPVEGLIGANRTLGIDCMVSRPIVPDERDQVRTGHVLDADRAHYQPESLKEDAEAIPATRRRRCGSRSPRPRDLRARKALFACRCQDRRRCCRSTVRR